METEHEATILDPLTHARRGNFRDAEKLVEAKLLKLPTASRWIGRYRVQAFSNPTSDPDRARRFTDGWTVIVSDPRDGVPFGQYFLSPTGRFITSTFAPGKFYGPVSTGAPAK